jgi:hypothetical protein
MKIPPSHIVVFIPASFLLYLLVSPVAMSRVIDTISPVFGQPSKSESPLLKPFVNDLKIVKLTNDSGKIRLRISDRSSNISFDVDACDENKLTKEIIYKCVSGSKTYDIVWSNEKPNILVMNAFDNGKSMPSQTLKYW